MTTKHVFVSAIGGSISQEFSLAEGCDMVYSSREVTGNAGQRRLRKRPAGKGDIYDGSRFPSVRFAGARDSLGTGLAADSAGSAIAGPPPPRTPPSTPIVLYHSLAFRRSEENG